MPAKIPVVGAEKLPDLTDVGFPSHTTNLQKWDARRQYAIANTLIHPFSLPLLQVFPVTAQVQDLRKFPFETPFVGANGF